MKAVMYGYLCQNCYHKTSQRVIQKTKTYIFLPNEMCSEMERIFRSIVKFNLKACTIG